MSGWLGMSLTLVGVAGVAWFPRHVRACLALFCLSAMVWAAHAVLVHDRSLLLTQVALFFINAIGVYRWRSQ